LPATVIYLYFSVAKNADGCTVRAINEGAAHKGVISARDWQITARICAHIAISSWTNEIVAVISAKW